MPCYSPIPAWQESVGSPVVFVETADAQRSLTLPCGQCIGCRLERSRQWAIRCVHEAQLHDYNSFVTLTYDDDHLPPDLSLHYYDYQCFMKRLRNSHTGVRFYMCGEYGDNFGRPHFHACLFNCFFPDRSFLSSTPTGFRLYRSPELERLWPFGFSSIGDVTFESAAYVARYVTKKVTGDLADSHYTFLDPDTGELIRRTPEFSNMSRRPGIAHGWYSRYSAEVHRADEIVIRGVRMKPPRYYDNLLKSADGFAFDDMQYIRHQNALLRLDDSTPERLAARAKVATARVALKSRSLK